MPLVQQLKRSIFYAQQYHRGVKLGIYMSAEFRHNLFDELDICIYTNNADEFMGYPVFVVQDHRHPDFVISPVQGERCN